MPQPGVDRAAVDGWAQKLQHSLDVDLPARLHTEFQRAIEAAGIAGAGSQSHAGRNEEDTATAGQATREAAREGAVAGVQAATASQTREIAESVEQVLRDDVSTVLQRTVKPAVQSALDKQLGGAIEASMRPLREELVREVASTMQEAVRDSVQRAFVPAMEAAAREMMAQMQAHMTELLAKETQRRTEAMRVQEQRIDALLQRLEAVPIPVGTASVHPSAAGPASAKGQAMPGKEPAAAGKTLPTAAEVADSRDTLADEVPGHLRADLEKRLQEVLSVRDERTLSTRLNAMFSEALNASSAPAMAWVCDRLERAWVDRGIAPDVDVAPQRAVRLLEPVVLFCTVQQVCFLFGPQLFR